MPNSPFYQSAFWQRLRRAVLERDRYHCAVPGCMVRATVVDHIVPRAAGGLDVMNNLRSLCKTHDGQIKERAGGVKRAMGGQLRVGCDMNGMPLDPRHPWARR